MNIYGCTKVLPKKATEFIFPILENADKIPNSKAMAIFPKRGKKALMCVSFKVLVLIV